MMHQFSKIFLLLFVWPSFAIASIRMGIISNSAYFGEREVGWRIKRAAESLGWEVFLDEERGSKILNIDNLDFTICLVPTSFPRPKGLNYMAVFHPFDLLDKKKKLKSYYESFDGYLLTIKPEFLRTAFRSSSKEFFFIPFYPTIQPIPYERVPLNNLIFPYPAWGKRHNGDKYKALYRLLSESRFTRFYGPKDSEGIVRPGHHIGQIPFDGISVINTLQKYGITLILHSSQHRNKKLPSGRIFEAAAASTVIICDEHPFVRKHFGDSVYYIDITLPAEEIFNQIASHVHSIFRHPEAALAKAKEAHQIFTDRFQMTDQLLALLAMHNRILSTRKKNL